MSAARFHDSGSEPSFQSTLAVTGPPELSATGVEIAMVAIPVLSSQVAVNAPVGGVTSGSGTERVATFPGLRPITARTLSEAFPGVAETVGAQDVVVTVAEESVAPPLVSDTRYDVALVTAFHDAATS